VPIDLMDEVTWGQKSLNALAQQYAN